MVQIPLTGRATVLAPQEAERLRDMKELIISGLHYYCETLDLTRCAPYLSCERPSAPRAQRGGCCALARWGTRSPFPSTHAATDPASEFVFNAFLRAPFEHAGAAFCCPPLLSGVALQHPIQWHGYARLSFPPLAPQPARDTECRLVCARGPPPTPARLLWSPYSLGGRRCSRDPGWSPAAWTPAASTAAATWKASSCARGPSRSVASTLRPRAAATARPRRRSQARPPACSGGRRCCGVPARRPCRSRWRGKPLPTRTQPPPRQPVQPVLPGR